VSRASLGGGAAASSEAAAEPLAPSSLTQHLVASTAHRFSGLEVLESGRGGAIGEVVGPHQFGAHATEHATPGVTVDTAGLLGVWYEARSTGCAAVERWKKVDSGWVWQEAQKGSCDSWLAANAKPAAVTARPRITSADSVGIHLRVRFWGSHFSPVMGSLLILAHVWQVRSNQPDSVGVRVMSNGTIV
jgi:hypothetical protein